MSTLPTGGRIAEPTGGALASGAPVLEEVNVRYCLLSYVGHGGMGVVFRARDRLTGGVVALKRLTEPGSGLAWATTGTPDLLNASATLGATPGKDGKRRLALAREFRTLAALRHPNIISVLDYGFARNGEPFFTMDLVEQPRTLLEAARGLAEAAKAELLVQSLRALAYLHRRNVIHRDLKPSNVLVNDRVRLLDFGISVSRGEGTRPSGTLSHMAPEVLLGEPSTEATDLYAVGVMAYEVFAGHHPFRGFTGEALRLATLSLEPELDGLGQRPALRALVTRLLAKDPGARFPDAGATIDALLDATAVPAPRHTRATRESFLQAASFVGRIDEQRALAGAVHELMAGRGGVWLIEGESGIGKTRLLDELRTLALVEGARVVRGQSDRDAGDAFGLWREPLRHVLLDTAVEDAEAGKLVALVPDVDALIGRPVVQSQAEPQSARAEMLATIGVIFARQRAPVLVLLEDLHWARDALDVLRELTPRLAGLPVLIVGSYRGEESPGLAASVPGAHQLRLGRLTRPDIAALAGSMLGSARAPVVNFLDQHTEGNLFFLVETVRALAEETGSLEQIGDSALPERLITSGIEAVVARRLAKLPPGLQPMLAWAAVVGRALDQPLLENVYGSERVAELLATGAEAGVLEVSDNRFRFAHDKIREHALQVMGRARRGDLHGEVAAALERVHGGGKPRAAALAYHYREAGHLEAEARWSALAGGAALEQGAYNDATRLLERALAIYEQSPPADQTIRLEAMLRYGAVLRGTQSWSTPAVVRVYDGVIELAAELGVEERTIPALHGLALSSLFPGDLATARGIAIRYRKLADDTGDVLGQIQAAVLLANVATWQGRHAEAELHHRCVLALYEPAQHLEHMARYGWDPRVVAAVTHAASTCIRGEVDAAVAIYRDALDAAEATGHPFAIAIALQTGAWVHYLRREVADTLRYADALSQLAIEHGFPVFVVLADAFGGWAMVHGGERDQPRGLERLQSAVATQRQIGGLATTLYALQLADGLLRGGAVADALSVLDGTLGDASVTQERCYHSELYRLRAAALRALGEPAHADAELASALALAREQGALLFEVRVRADLMAKDVPPQAEIER